MITENKKSAAGFTLIETIVTLVVAAIIGIFFYTFFSTSIYKSHLPMENLVRANDLNQVMENIRTDYKPYPVWQPNHNYNVNDQVMPTAFSLSGQRYWYQCTQPGTSGSISQGPLPPLIDSSMNNLYTFIGAPDPSNKKCANLPNEKCYDQSTNKYGYYVIENGWIDFDLTTKTASTSTNHNILKVTIKNDEGETVTALFFPN
jgi:prepilin-type N-terminal cleavage/methylation domain-containing protein